MSDEIYINHGSAFQQPYQGQVTVNAQEPNIRNIQQPNTRGAQAPFTYQNRAPFTYRNPVSAQEPNIRSKQSPFTYNRTGRSPYIYQHPFTYTADARQPGTYQVQSPFTYRVPVNAQQPTIKNAQQPYPYIANGQEPNIRSKQSPFTYQYGSPFTFNSQGSIQEPYIGYAPVQAQGPYIGATQEPNSEIGSPFRIPLPYQAQGPHTTQQAYQYQANRQVFQSPFTVNQQSPSPYIYQTGQLFGLITYPWGMESEQEYRYSRQNVSAQQPNPSTTPARQPVITYNNIGNARGPVIAQGQQPNVRDIRQPLIYQYRSPYNYNRTGQSPFTYDHRSPFTYRNPVSSQESNPVNSQTPFTYIANARQPSSAQQTYPYIANSRQPIIYDHRSPFTYRNPVNGQQPYIADARQPFTYNYRSPFTYDHRSPFTTQQNYPTTRPIDAVAKVKGAYVNDGGTLRKAQEIYVNAPQGVEKIHQSVPTAQFNKT